jgi:hypothetical protein
VPPLVVPDLRRLPDLDALTQFEAIALFIERARAAKSGFTVTNENVRPIAEICVRLDGLPLAIELAAAWIRALPPQTLLGRLDHRLQLLTGGAQDLDERQRTLRATIGWSYELLSEQEKMLLARISVFADGFRLDAAEAVCDDDADLALDLLDGLASLIDKNLLKQKTDPDGEPRYWSLETIQEFAYERLGESIEAEAIRRRHGEHYLRLSEQAARQLEGGEHQSTWMMRLEQEHSNLRSALTFWRREPESQVAIALSLEPFWRLRGHWQEGRRWLEEALAASNEASPQRLRALEDTHYFAYLQGDTERARMLLEEMLPLARRLENRPMIALALNGLANLEGNHDRAAVLYEESLKFCEGEHDSVHPLSGLGFLALFRSDYKSARMYFERSITIGRAFRDDYEVVQDMASLAMVAAFEGEEQEAMTLVGESIELAHKLDSRPALVSRCLPALAALRSLQGQAEASVILIGASEGLREDMGSPGGRITHDVKQRILEAAKRKLATDQITTAFEEGRALTLDEALANAP